MDTVIYHKNCRDGFGAALAAYHCLDERAHYVACQYGEDPPSVEADSDVYILDFSFSKLQLVKLAGECRSVVVIDHHKTALQQLLGIPTPPAPGAVIGAHSLYAMFDMQKSGAVLAWEYFNPEERVPELLYYVQDRDLWQWKLPCSREVSAGLEMLPMDFEAWQAYLRDTSGLAEIGATVLRYKQTIVDAALKSVGAINLGGRTVLVTNTPVLISETCEAILLKWGGVAGCYFDTAEDTRVYSLRSHDPDGPDVSEIAKKYGGGGHKHAAGFTVPR